MNELYPFQRAGVEFLTANSRAYLADEMGLGKTVQAIVAARKTGARRTLIVCPASVQENWKREWAEWRGPGEPTVVSYAKLIREIGSPKEVLWYQDLDLVILDEAHYCKSPSAQRTKAALRIARDADRAWLLSGTPMPNDPRELYPVFKVLWPGALPPKNAFAWMDRYCKWSSSDYGYRVWGSTPLARTELLPALREVMLRRKLTDVALELPPLRYDVQYLEKDPDLAEELERLGARDDEEHMATLRRILGQYKAGPIATEILRELRDGQYQDIVVLYHHHDTGDELRRLLEPAARMWGFDGSSAPHERQANIDAFQEHGGIFLAQQTAAGIGITLTRASEIVLVEPSWSPEDNQQAIKRIHRIGQDNPCRARLFAVPGSLDEALMATLRRKSRMISEIVDGS